MHPLIGLTIGLLVLAPIYLAWRGGLPLSEGYRLAIIGYHVGQTYSVAQIVITDYAVRGIAIVPYFALASVVIWQSFGLRRRFEPQVVAAMHVLDVMLWRRAQRKGV